MHRGLIFLADHNKLYQLGLSCSQTHPQVGKDLGMLVLVPILGSASSAIMDVHRFVLKHAYMQSHDSAQDQQKSLMSPWPDPFPLGSGSARERDYHRRCKPIKYN